MTLNASSTLTLDDAQQRVVDAPPHESAVVVGAPGTGKTTALIRRVAALVARGISADDLVVLTPNRTSATVLRDSLGLTAGTATLGPLARSMSSFAYGLVRAHEVALGRESPQLLTGGDDDQIVRDLLEGDAVDEETFVASGEVGRWPEDVGPEVRATRGFRSELRTFMAECTTRGITPTDLARWSALHDVPVWASAGSFMSEYLEVRARMRGAYRDAATLVREAIPRAVDAASAGLRVVLVDDAQELTRGGVALLEALRREGVAVFAFGDPDVGSGAFRGATPENFARLTHSLGAQMVLSDNHRSTKSQDHLVRTVTQQIGASGVVQHRRPPVPVDDDGSIATRVVRSLSEEIDLIARALRERHIHDHVPWSECAVIAHDGRQVAMLETELSAREVPTAASGPGLPLGELRPVRDLVGLIALALEEGEWQFEDVERALMSSGLDAIELRRLRSALRHAELGSQGTSSARELILSAMRNPVEFVLLDTREGRQAARVAETVSLLRDQREQGSTAHELLWTAWERSGNARAWREVARGTGPTAAAADRDLDAVVSLFQAAKRFGERLPDAEPLLFIRGITDSDVAEDRLETALPRDAVRVLTPAAAASTEFDTVIVAGVQDGVWPNTRVRGSILHTWNLAHVQEGSFDEGKTIDRRRDALNDELRLFVRAISRARRRVMVTAVDDEGTGPSVFFSLLPSPSGTENMVDHPLTLRGLVAQHRRAVTDPHSSSETQAQSAGQLAILAHAGVAGAAPAQWYTGLYPTSTGPVRDVFREDIRVSPSLIHSIEECELNWVIADLGGDSGGSVAGLGTIIHAALETAESSSIDALWSVVERRWGELDFDAAWRERSERTRARELIRRLHAYLRQFEAAGGSLLDAEPHFEVEVSASAGESGEVAQSLHGIVLSGFIDRVEREADGSVVIVDLKTGKSEPQTDAKVIDNAQLAAYQLALESGVIAGTQGSPSGGAKLLVLQPTSKSADFVTPTQPPLSAAAREDFRERVRGAARTMQSTQFCAPYETHCRSEFSYGLCRIHTIGPVSAS